MTTPRPLARVTHEALYLSEDGLAALEAPIDVPRAPIAGVAAQSAQPSQPARPAKQDRIGALRLRDFRFLFIGTVTSGYGQWATMIGLGWLAYVLSGESAAQLAWVVAVGGAMRLFSAPWIGVVLDRYHRRSVTVWSTLASAALGLGLGVLVMTDLVAFWQLYVFSALEGIISSANQNVRQTFVYDVTTPDTLSNAIALNAIAQNLSRISGPPLAGAMIGLLGTASPFLFIAVMMTIATFFTLLISKTTRQAALDTDSPLRSLWVGIRYVASDRPMLGLLLSGAVPGIFLYPYIPLLPVFAEEVLGTGSTGYGLLAASVGWGSLTGLLVLSWLGDVRHKGIIA
ncbi:MAG: MFS transporter, partial [Chloroflexi bacterium]|nr:MFS transporter [Chloroflexota bacterium]